MLCKVSFSHFNQTLLSITFFSFSDKEISISSNDLTIFSLFKTVAFI